MKPNQFIVSITFAIDDEGTLQEYLFTDGVGQTTLSTDTPASTFVYPDLIDPGTVQRSLFKDGKIWGAMEASYGLIEIDNSDGRWDVLATYGISGHPIKFWWGEQDAAYPSAYTNVLIVYGLELLCSFDKITVRVRDRMWMLDKLVTSGVVDLPDTFQGTGDLEGPAAMTGKPKQRLLNFAGYAPVIPVNPATQLYQVTTGYAYNTEVRMFEGGVELTLDPYYTPVLATFLAYAVAAGEFVVWSGDATTYGPIYVRLGSVPVYELRTLTEGTTDNNATDRFTFARLATELGLSWTGTTVPFGARYVLTGQESYLDLMSDACMHQNAYFGFTRLDVFGGGYFLAPNSAESVFEFTQHNSKGFQRRPPQGFPAPAYKIVANIGEVWPCTVQAGSNAYEKEILERTGNFQVATLEAPEKLLKHPNATSVVLTSKNGGQRLDTNAQNGADDLYDANAFTYGFLGLYGSDNEYVTLTLLDFDLAALEIELTDTVGVRMPRFSMETPKYYRVVGIQQQLKQRQITFNLWGGDPTPYEPPVAGVDEWWVYGDVSEQFATMLAAIDAATDTAPSTYDRPWMTYMTGTSPVSTASSNMYVIRKLVVRDDPPYGTILSSEHNHSLTAPTTTWTPVTGGDPGPTIQNLGVLEDPDVTFCVWKITPSTGGNGGNPTNNVNNGTFTIANPGFNLVIDYLSVAGSNDIFWYYDIPI